MSGLHDTTHSPVGLWQLIGALTDSSGNGLTLTQSRGASRFGEMVPGWTSYTSVGSLLSELSRTVTDAGLILLGDMSIGLLTTCTAASGGGQDFLLGFGTAYELGFDAGGVHNSFVWKQAGVTYTSTFHFPPHQPLHLYATRISNVIRFYVNGRIAATSGTLTAPTGNGTSKLFMQANNNTAYNGGTGFCSVKIVPSGLTGVEVLAEYNRTLGMIFPPLSP